MSEEYIPRHAKKSDSLGPDSKGPGKHERWRPVVPPSESFERADTLNGEAISLPRQENRANGRRVLNLEDVKNKLRQNFSSIMHPVGEKAKSHEQLFTDYGLSMLNRGDLIDKPNRPIEDHAYINADQGIFAVFDGAGGVRGGAEASTTAAHALSHCVFEKGAPNSIEGMHSLLEAINRSVVQNPNAGMTTAVVGRILQDENGQHHLLYASVGDSRIYQIRGKHIRALTQDEGYGNVVTNSLGKNSKGAPVCSGINQVGLVPLQKGDSILFNSDGITGDFEKDFIPEPELAQIVSTAESPNVAAQNLVRRATKVDDRTALVVKI